MQKRTGVAMLIVIALILLLLILGGTVLMISTGHFRTSYHQVERARAYYAAEAAMQHALWRLRTGQTALPPPGGSANINFPNAINGIPATNISITVEDINGPTEQPVGVYPINITVDY